MDLRAAFFAFHLVLVTGISCRETLWLMGRGLTVLSKSLDGVWQNAESLASAVLGRGLAQGNPARQVINAYLHSAGIETGYGFFAPNVPDNYELVFELHYPDGRIEYELPSAGRHEGHLRLASLMDEIGGTASEPLREVMIKLLAHSTWEVHPDAIMIRALLGTLTLPTIAEFQRGKPQTYKFSYAYKFTLSDAASSPHTP